MKPALLAVVLAACATTRPADLTSQIVRADRIRAGRVSKVFAAPSGRARLVLSEPESLDAAATEPGDFSIDLDLPRRDGLDAAALRSFSGQRVIVFEEGYGGWLLEGPGAIRRATPEAIAEVCAEQARQARLSASFSGTVWARPAPIDRDVAAQLSRLTDPATSPAALKAILALGCPAVPALIRQLDDPRPYAGPALHLILGFEAMREDTPRVLTDAIVALLNQLTGRTFGVMSEREDRNRTIRRWENWLAATEGRCSSGW